MLEVLRIWKVCIQFITESLDDYALELIESLKEMRKKIRMINDHGSYKSENDKDVTLIFIIFIALMFSYV